jgi:hypothetical protein
MMDGMNNSWGMESGLGWGLIIVIAILVVAIGIYAKLRKKIQ